MDISATLTNGFRNGFTNARKFIKHSQQINYQSIRLFNLEQTILTLKFERS